MDFLNYTECYETLSDKKRCLLDKLFLNTRGYFFLNMIYIVFWLRREILQGRYSNETWCDACDFVRVIIEKCGGKIHVKGINNINFVEGPVVFISNHMSTLETFLLPAIIAPRKPITFIVKQSLLTYPAFGTIMRATNPIAVGRENPMDDFKVVMKEGVEILNSGKSIIVFPQSTRGPEFNAKEFNSIGIKLAKKAGVPVIPLALKTDFWGNGKKIKDFGPITRKNDVYFEFDKPIMKVEGTGKNEHSYICDYIESRLNEWKQKI